MENNLNLVKNDFKELPNNIEAEQAVIGSILVSNEIFDEINTIILIKIFMINAKKYSTPLKSNL